MTASLYQSGSGVTAVWVVATRSMRGSAIKGGSGCCGTVSRSWREEGVESGFAVLAQFHHVRRADLGVQHHEVVRAVPGVDRAGEHVVHLVVLLGPEAEGFEIDADPAA